jgi:hypothetical protein
VRERAGEAAGADPRPASGGAAGAWPAFEAPAGGGHGDHVQSLRDGRALAVTLGADARPLGDLGHPNVDGRLLELMLANDTPAARLLRAHGIDEADVRALIMPDASS